MLRISLWVATGPRLIAPEIDLVFGFSVLGSSHQKSVHGRLRIDGISLLFSTSGSAYVDKVRLDRDGFLSVASPRAQLSSMASAKPGTAQHIVWFELLPDVLVMASTARGFYIVRYGGRADGGVEHGARAHCLQVLWQASELLEAGKVFRYP